jgi:hypothetical protein
LTWCSTQDSHYFYSIIGEFFHIATLYLFGGSLYYLQIDQNLVFFIFFSPSIDSYINQGKPYLISFSLRETKKVIFFSPLRAVKFLLYVSSIAETLDPDVKILSLSIVSPGRSDIVLPIPEDGNPKGLWFTLKEGSKYRLKFSFQVSNNIVSGLKYTNTVWKSGIRGKSSVFLELPKLQKKKIKHMNFSLTMSLISQWTAQKICLGHSVLS